MAGTYTKKEYSAGLEEQNLLKDPNSAQIIAKVAEPVKLSPGWEGCGKPEEELNFKEVTMDQADLELNPPKDRMNLIYLIMVIHGIGVLISWNMFMTAQKYFQYKLAPNNTEYQDQHLATSYITNAGLAAQIPNLIFNWMNIFMQFGGDLMTRIIWGIFPQIVIFIGTIILAMINTFNWTLEFYWITLISIAVINAANGIYQNSIYGMAAKMPGKYTGAVILGSNISGTFVAFVNLFVHMSTPNDRTAAIYYFLSALLVLLICFDTYFALPINRFYRYHELMNEKDKKKRELENNSNVLKKTPYWKIFKQCFPQLFNIFMIFFVTLALFPEVQMRIKQSSTDFIFPKKYYQDIMCFITFNVTAMLGSSIASRVQWPNKKWIVVPVLLRLVFIPLFLMCKYVPNDDHPRDGIITNDWVYLIIAITMGLSSGYLSSLCMMYCPTMVDLSHASTAGMFAGAVLITGICSGIVFAKFVPHRLVALFD